MFDEVTVEAVRAAGGGMGRIPEQWVGPGRSYLSTRRYSVLESSLRALHSVIAPSFVRAEPRQRALHYMLGLSGILAGPVVNRRTIGSAVPGDGARRLLTSARWDEFEAREDLRQYVRATAGPGDLFVTEASFLKRGGTAVAIDRQFSVDTGQEENCQIAVLLFHVTDDDLYLLDAELYLPPHRCTASGTHPRARSKSVIAEQMIERAARSGFRPAWVLSHLVCPEKFGLLRTLWQAGTEHLSMFTPGESLDLDRYACPAGMAVSYPVRVGEPFTPMTGTFCCRACTHTPLDTDDLRRVTSRMLTTIARWRAARRRVRIDDYEVRSWQGWQRHMTLAMAVQIAVQTTMAADP